MSTFKEYLTDTVHYEEIIGYIAEEAELDTLGEELVEIESELNELFGLGKLADKLKGRAADKAKAARKDIADESKKHFEEQKAKRAEVRSKEEKRKAFADKVADVSSRADKAIDTHIVKRAAGIKTAVDNKIAEVKAASEKRAEEKKVEAQGKKYEKERADAKSAEDWKNKKEAVRGSWLTISSSARGLFNKTFKNVKDVTPDQKKVLADLEGIYEKLSANKAVTGLEAIKVIAAVLAGSGDTGAVPSYKAYTNQLNRLRTLPGMSGFKFAVKAN